jgi:hypothetical protein
MLIRPSVDIGPHEEVIAVHDERMTQLLGELDSIDKMFEESSADPMRALTTYNNAKT